MSQTFRYIPSRDTSPSSPYPLLLLSIWIGSNCLLDVLNHCAVYFNICKWIWVSNWLVSDIQQWQLYHCLLNYFFSFTHSFSHARTPTIHIYTYLTHYFFNSIPTWSPSVLIPSFPAKICNYSWGITAPTTSRVPTPTTLHQQADTLFTILLVT